MSKERISRREFIRGAILAAMGGGLVLCKLSSTATGREKKPEEELMEFKNFKRGIYNNGLCVDVYTFQVPGQKEETSGWVPLGWSKPPREILDPLSPVYGIYPWHTKEIREAREAFVLRKVTTKKGKTEIREAFIFIPSPQTDIDKFSPINKNKETDDFPPEPRIVEAEGLDDLRQKIEKMGLDLEVVLSINGIEEGNRVLERKVFLVF